MDSRNRRGNAEKNGGRKALGEWLSSFTMLSCFLWPTREHAIKERRTRNNVGRAGRHLATCWWLPEMEETMDHRGKKTPSYSDFMELLRWFLAQSTTVSFNSMRTIGKRQISAYVICMEFGTPLTSMTFCSPNRLQMLLDELSWKYEGEFLHFMHSTTVQNWEWISEIQALVTLLNMRRCVLLVIWALQEFVNQ